MNYVEFYFPGVSCVGRKEREVSSREVEMIGIIPKNAISCRFFSKDEKDNKVDFSSYYYFGKEYSLEEFKGKFPQLASDFANAKRIVKTVTGGFYPLSKDDKVILV